MQNKKWTLFWFQFENVKKAEHAEMSFADFHEGNCVLWCIIWQKIACNLNNIISYLNKSISLREIITTNHQIFF
jgi:hypothetical protein